MLRIVPASLLALGALAPLAAAEKPLGAVESLDGTQVVLGFDASVQLAPGTVVAIYGPGSLEKHPLTNEVIVERPKLLAKALVLGTVDGKYRARIAWSEPQAAITKGCDAVPLPGEAAPNTPPAPTGPMAPVEAPIAAVTAVKIPVMDPDGDAVSYSWRLDGPAGRAGRLEARTTSRPEVAWSAPAAAGEAALIATARDRLGQEASFTVPLAVKADEGDLRKRGPQPWIYAGGERHLSRLERAGDGSWWGYDAVDGRSLIRLDAGWNADRVVKPGGAGAPSAIAALVPFRGELYCLDPSASCIHVYNPDGARTRQIGKFSRPSDLAIDAQGTLYVADQNAGGVLVYENDGRFRARLGMEGKGADGFVGLSRLCLGPAGELYCLDAEQRIVSRFDRFHRRLDSYEIQGDPRNAPVDLAVHPRGLLVLLANGAMQLFDAKGLAKEALPPATDGGLGIELGAPDGLAVDGNDEVYVSYAAEGVVARYNAAGRPSGVRGHAAWAACRTFAADGAGRVFGLDPSANEVRAFDPAGFLVARVGGLGRELIAIAVSPDGSAVAVLDADKVVVQRLKGWSLGEKPLAVGQKGSNNGQFKEPVRVALDEAGRLYVLDAGLHRVAAFDPEGRFLFTFGRYERGKAGDELLDPRLLAVSPAGDAAYVYDYDRFDVKKYAIDQAKQTATHVTNAGGKGDSPGQIRKLAGLGCDRRGLLYLLDIGREDLQVLDFRGSNAVAIHAWKLEGVLGVRRAEHLAVAPDGQFLIGPAGSAITFRW
jgi:tripartite motif-containing protein 71